jgi:hypothetical protein
MAFYLGKEREADVTGSYKRYLEYLHEQQHLLPASAFALATATWYYDTGSHRCPHDAWLESITITEHSTGTRSEQRHTSIRIRLLAASHDAFIEFFYPQVFSYSLLNPASARGLGDWCYDEFRVSPTGHLLHEIEWAGFPHQGGSRWIIEASDVEFIRLPKSSA